MAGKGQPRKHTPEQVAEIISKYRDGMSQTKLAREYDCSSVTISHILKREGVEARPFKNRPWRTFSPEEQEEIVRCWHSGESQSKIAKRFGTDQTVISRYLNFHGIEPVTRQHNQRGELNLRWKGGVISNLSGYRAVKVQPDDEMACMRFSNGYVLEHRLVMARHLGRPLEPHENVHHINGVRTDNRLENLELWSTSQPNGQRADDKVTWAIEFLKDQGYEVNHGYQLPR
jgi:transposase-like protein